MFFPDGLLLIINVLIVLLDSVVAEFQKICILITIDLQFFVTDNFRLYFVVTSLKKFEYLIRACLLLGLVRVKLA